MTRAFLARLAASRLSYFDERGDLCDESLALRRGNLAVRSRLLTEAVHDEAAQVQVDPVLLQRLARSLYVLMKVRKLQSKHVRH